MNLPEDKPVNATETPAAARVDAMAIAAFDIGDAMQVVLCPVCLEYLAARRVRVQRAAVKREEIHCPAGHTFIPGIDPETPPISKVLLLNLELLAQVADLRRRLGVLTTELATIRPAAGAGEAPPADREELKRRARILANRAEPATYGHQICPFCAKPKNRRNLAEHIFMRHAGNLGGTEPQKQAGLNATA